MSKRVVVIGAGFGGLSTAALLAHAGHQVTVVEKNDAIGGRAFLWRVGDFAFDAGPSWYLMPDVFERYFALLGTTPEAHLDLRRLSPSYRIYFGPGDAIDMPADLEEARALFDTFEPDGGRKLSAYLERAGRQYEIAMGDFIYRDYARLSDLLDRRLLLEGAKLQVFRNLDRYVGTFFDSDRARKVLEYTMVFLGGAPNNTPALYSMMSHVDVTLGVWYPMGGMAAVAEALRVLGESHGVEVVTGRPVDEIIVRRGSAVGVRTGTEVIEADAVVATADYHHVETELLAPEHRQYSERYWRTRVVAPSAFLLYLGLSRPVPGLLHHTLFLQHDWMQHFDTIFRDPSWPERPSYYVCAPTKTDTAMAPPGGEALVVLVPVAAGLEDTPEIRERYESMALDSLEQHIGEPIRDAITVKRTFAHRDFSSRFNAFKGTGLGLAHTLRQTAVFRPRHTSSKVEGLYFAGHYTHPGIGVPTTLIASEIVARKIGT